MPAVIMIGPHKGDGPSDDDTEDMPTDKPDSGAEARMEAAKALIRGVKMGDAKAVDKALYAHWSACEKTEEPEGDEGGDEGESGGKY